MPHKAVHINLVFAMPGEEVLQNPTEQEATALMAALEHRNQGTGYSRQQSTKPQTLGYGLTDSPAGQAAWILEKFYEWADCGDHPEKVFSRDRLLDNVMIYWLTASAASSARLYWESFTNIDMSAVDVPTGCTIFAKEIAMPSRRWAEARYRNIIFWNEQTEGGHFAAMEKPHLLAEDIRASVATGILEG